MLHRIHVISSVSRSKILISYLLITAPSYQESYNNYLEKIYVENYIRKERFSMQDVSSLYTVD